MASSKASPQLESVKLPLFVKIQVVLAIFAIAVTIAVALTIPGLLTRRAGLEADIRSLNKQKADLQKQTGDLQKQRDAVSKMYGDTVAAYAEANPERARATVNKSISENPSAAALLPRIFLHIGNNAQRPR